MSTNEMLEVVDELLEIFDSNFLKFDTSMVRVDDFTHGEALEIVGDFHSSDIRKLLELVDRHWMVFYFSGYDDIHAKLRIWSYRS